MGVASSPSNVVLITGANQGIGFEIAKKLAAEQDGYHIILTSRRRSAVEEAADKLRQLGLSSVEALELDVTSDASIESAARAVDDKFGRLDVLINNAAVSAAGPGTKSRSEWSQLFDTNVTGAVKVMDTFIPLLAKSRTGSRRIVCMSSSLGSMTLKTDPGAAEHAVSYYLPYSASKAALNMAVYQYAVRFERDGSWKVNLCCPGSCSTQLNGFDGVHGAEHGAVNACRLATLGPEGETGTFSDRDGIVPW